MSSALSPAAEFRASPRDSRIALGSVPAWQIVLAIALMVAAICGMARLAGRIYARSIMYGGARLSWRAALRLR